MKNKLSLILILICIICLAGCKKETKEQSLENNSKVEFNDENKNYKLTLDTKDINPSGLTLIINNLNENANIQTGSAYYLEVFKNNDWEKVKELPLPKGVDAYAWDSLAYIIENKSTKEFEINWEWIYGKLPSGKYRLIKEFMDFKETGNFNTFECMIEFEIK